jgi:deoxyribose-phosphate aldolase
MKPSKRVEEMTVKELAAYIDQSVLKPEFAREEIKKYIQEGITCECKTVCINPFSLDIARDLCKSAREPVSASGICVVSPFCLGRPYAAYDV